MMTYDRRDVPICNKKYFCPSRLSFLSFFFVFFRKQQKITNKQNEKFDEYESIRMTTMAEMKFIENKLQSFDINAKPSVTHTQIEKLQKVRFQNK